jgi:cobalt-zinc-cadmium efflux system protein
VGNGYGHAHAHGHSHGLSASAPALSGSAALRHRRRLVIALLLTGVFLAVEVVVAVATGSLVLLSDAGHMTTDLVALGLALGAVTVAALGSSDPQRSYGTHRLEVLAALANGLLLVGVGVVVTVEAVRRVGEPPTVPGLPLLLVALLGLALNVSVYLLLREGARESLTVEAAVAEVFADALGSVAVLAAGLVVLATGWPYVDPLVALGLAAYVVPRGLRLSGRALRVLLQVAPASLPIRDVSEALSGVDGVVEVHDVHAWTLTSGMEVLSAHLVVGRPDDSHPVLDRARALLQDRFGVAHATLQVEPVDHLGCEELTW